MYLDTVLATGQAMRAAAGVGAEASQEAKRALRRAGAALRTAHAGTAAAAQATEAARTAAGDLAAFRALRAAAAEAHMHELNKVEIFPPKWPQYVPLPPMPVVR